MRKELWILVVASMVLLAAFAAADDASEVAAFGSGWGAKVRLLQLDAAIERNVLYGNAVVDAVNAENSSVDTSDLEAILAEMEALDEQVKAADPQAGADGAQAFLDLKSDATNLTKAFREEARGLLKASDIQDLKGQIKDVNSDSLRQLRGEINQTRLDYNADALENALSGAGLSNPSLVDAVRSGDAKMKDVMDYLKGALGNMSKSERQQTIQSLREQEAKRGVFAKAAVDRVALNRSVRQQVRLQDRLELADSMNLGNATRMRLEKRIEKVGGRIERIENRTDNRIMWAQNWTEKHVEKLDVLKGRLQNRTWMLEDRMQGRLDGGNLTDQQSLMLQNRLGKVENRSGNMMGKIEDRIDRVENRGQMMQDKLRGNGGGMGGGQ